jgi:glycosyltransferase involved in cell wall biosynthesis
MSRLRLAVPVTKFVKTGGIERATVEMAIRLAKSYEVNVLSGSWSDELVPTGVRSNVRFHRIPYYESPRLLRCLFPLFVRNHLESHRYDCIINHGVGASLIQDILIATSCHRAWLVDLMKDGIKRTILDPENITILAVERHNYKKGNYKKIISFSHFLTGMLIKSYDIPEKDIVTIHEGVNTDEFSINDREKMVIRKKVRSSLGLSDRTFMLLFVSNEFKRKGLDIVLESLNAVKNRMDFKLVVVGKDNPQKFASAIGKYGLRDNIIFTGTVSDEKLKSYYFSSDVFIFPTRHDAFGMVITEAMASGLPVITSNFAGASEIITNYKDGIVVDSFDPQKYAEAILRLHDDESLRKSLGDRAAKTAKNYSWDKVIDRIMKVIEEVSR